jgi:hypothetical protein
VPLVVSSKYFVALEFWTLLCHQPTAVNKRWKLFKVSWYHQDVIFEHHLVK